MESENQAAAEPSGLNVGLVLPDDARQFIYEVTLHLQASRSKTPEQMDSMFQKAYCLYVKYDVECRDA